MKVKDDDVDDDVDEGVENEDDDKDVDGDATGDVRRDEAKRTPTGLFPLIMFFGPVILLVVPVGCDTP